MPCLPTGHSTIWRPIIFPAIIQALQPTDTGTVVATGGPLGLLALLGLALTGVGCSRNKSGSLALFAAIRRASSRVARVTFFVPPRNSLFSAHSARRS